MPNFNNLFAPPQQIQFQNYDNGALAAALRNQQSGQQSGQQQQQTSNNQMSNALRAGKELYNMLSPDTASQLAGMGLGGAGEALAFSPLFGGAGAAGYGGGVASTALPGIFPGATVAAEGYGGAGALGGAGGLSGGAAATTPAWAFAPLAIAVYGMLNGIFGPEDGPGYSTRDRANSYGMQALSSQMSAEGLSWFGVDPSTLGDPVNWSGEGLATPMYRAVDYIGNGLDYLKDPNVKSYFDQVNAAYNGGGRSGMDMDHFYYENDDPYVAAWLYSKYGAPNQDQMRQGLGGYSTDQYGTAEDYFHGLITGFWNDRNNNGGG